VRRLATWRAAATAPAGPSGEDLVASLRAALAADLDTPRALSIVDTWADEVLAGDGTDPSAPAMMAAAVDALLGIRLH
jgi:L-cysteine:1D-myo-inositol 2-amino-2-deoxy-alpha-D-glucopyranoside ligase